MSDEPTHLLLRDGTRLGWLEKDYNYYLRKMSILYGGSGTGKSIILDEMMNLLRPHVPVVFVIAPTNSSNQAFTGKVPNKCIKDGRNLKKLVAWLEKFITRQKNTSQMYMHANNIKNLKVLFDMVADSQAKDIELSITKKASDSLIFIDSSPSLNFAQKKTQKSAIKVERDNMLRKVYKTSIRYHRVKLEESGKLSKEENMTLMFLDLNPHVLLVLDDFASQFKKLYKMTTAVKEIFYEGRQSFITTIITTQDDKEIDSELRKNSMVNIFTTEQVATAAFDRASNYYPKHVKSRAKVCIETVFKQDPTKVKHFQKLVYINSLSEPFRYTIADLYDDYKMGCDSLWEFDEKVGLSSHHNEIENNPFFSKYS